MSDLDKLRDIYIADEGLTEEERADNAAKITEWERGLRESEALLSWKEHDFTREITARAKEHYRALGIRLATVRTLTEQERLSMWAKQDAMAWLLSLSQDDPKKEIELITNEIKLALDATN